MTNLMTNVINCLSTVVKIFLHYEHFCNRKDTINDVLHPKNEDYIIKLKFYYSFYFF